MHGVICLLYNGQSSINIWVTDLNRTYRKRSSANISTDSSRTENIGRNIGGIFSLQFLSSMLWFTISYLPKQFSQATIYPILVLIFDLEYCRLPLGQSASSISVPSYLIYSTFTSTKY